MDADRFDALTRSLSTVTPLGSRRGLLRGLLSGMVGLIATGLGQTEGSAGNDAGIIDRSPPRRRRRPKQPRWNAPRCRKRLLQRCLKPAEAKFLRAIEPCRRQCEGDPKRSACKACIRPHAVALADAAEKCTARFCRGGTTQSAAATAAPTAAGTAGSSEPRSAALQSCQSQQLTTCNNRAERNYIICLVAAGAACVGSAGFGCAAAIIGCGVLYATSVSDCNEDFGCSPGICLPSNVCCPTGFHTPCGDKCCPSGQICEGGTCKCPGGVLACGTTCCDAIHVGCEGNRCLLECDIRGDCGG